MKGMIRLIQALLAVIWVSLLVLSVLLFMNVQNGELPGVSQWRGLVISDTSMEPELLPDDLAVIHMGAASLPGDTVLCMDSSGRPALSRIIGTSEGQLILKADNLEDGHLASESDILGVMSTYIPGFGPAFQFLCSLPGIIVIFAAGLVLIVLPSLFLRTPPPPKPPRRPAKRTPRRDSYVPRH